MDWGLSLDPRQPNQCVDATATALTMQRLSPPRAHLQGRLVVLRCDVRLARVSTSADPRSVINVILRFSWLIYLSPRGSYAEIGYIVALGELCRRTLWSIFRVESEHVGNADGCAVALPIRRLIAPAIASRATSRCRSPSRPSKRAARAQTKTSSTTIGTRTRSSALLSSRRAACVARTTGRRHSRSGVGPSAMRGRATATTRARRPTTTRARARATGRRTSRRLGPRRRSMQSGRDRGSIGCSAYRAVVPNVPSIRDLVGPLLSLYVRR